MPDFADHEPVPEPEGLKERFDRLEAMIDAQGRAIAFLLCAVTKQPAQITDMPGLLAQLGHEMPGSVIPASASGLVLGQ